MRRGAVRRAVEAWLPAGLEGPEAVRAEVAVRLAVELDNPDTPPYVVARLASVLVEVVEVIEGPRSPVPVGDVRLARELLRDVLA